MRTLLLAFAGAFIVGLLWAAPLRLFLDDEQLRTFSVGASAVHGRVWDGRVENASVRGAGLGDVRVGVRLLPLFTGVRKIRFEAAGLSGSVLQGRVSGLQDASGAAPLAWLRSGAPLSGTLQLRGATMTFDEGGCRDAGGQVSVEAGFGAGAPVRLAGGLACQGKAGVAALRSTGGTPAVAATVSFGRNGRFKVASTVASADPGVRAALLLGGFQPGAAGLTRTDQGRLLR